MTIIEKKSERKKKAIMMLVESNEYSIAYAMMLAEQLNDETKLLDNDYEELMEWLETKLNPPTPEPEEDLSIELTEDE
jgi:hypothetical protein